MTVAERQAGTLQGVLLLLPITMAVMGLIVLVPVLPGMMAHFHDVPGVEYLVPLMLTLRHRPAAGPHGASTAGGPADV